MNNVLEIKRTIKDNVAPNSNLTFNVASPYSEGITYDTSTGEIILPEIGQYTVRWWVSTETSLSGCIQFALKSTQGDLVVGCSPTKRGQVVGFADIYAKEAKVKLSLVNSGSSNVYLSKTAPVTASLLATAVSGNGLNGNIIPFSVGKYGVPLETDGEGNPKSLVFSGFGASVSEGIPLKQGEWEAGIIDGTSGYIYVVSFIMPHDATLKKIHVLASYEYDNYPLNGNVRAFACIATSATGVPIYNILKDSITYTEPFEKDIIHQRHDVRRGMLSDINIKIQEGTVVGIVVGMTAEDITNPAEPPSVLLAINGAVYLE